jgi:repressor LexA
MARKSLTSRQQNVLTFVRQFLSRQGFPPTLREIGEAVGLSNINAVRGHLAALEKKGYITKAPDKARSIQIVDQPSSFSRVKRKLHEVLQTDEGVLHQIVYGLAWATWRCEDHLTGSRAEHLHRALEREAAEHGWTLIEERIEPDHVVLVVRAWPNHSPELAVRRFQAAGKAISRQSPKGLSARRLWSTGYVATTDLDMLDELVAQLLNRTGSATPGPTDSRSGRE